MASPAVHEPNKITRKKKLSGQQKREDLEREVTMLRSMLDHQQKVHEIMERVHRRNDHHSALSIPNFLPPKAKELFAELAMVEDEISRLETQISQLQTDLNREKEINKEYKFQQLHPATLNNQRRFSSLPSPKSNPSTPGASERVPFETKSLHFISKAITGDYNVVNDFSIKESLMGNLRAFKENNFNKEVGIQQLEEKGVSRKSGMLKPISPSPLRNPTPSPRRQSNAEISLDLLPRPIASPIQRQSEEAESIQKWPPNKLAENIMKCLILIFVRLLRTSRAMELEKSGAINSRSAINFSMSSRLSFRVDSTSSNNTTNASSLLQKESKQQDPYGIFNSEESIPRDIGPYKNLVMFTARNLDPKCISNSSSIPLVQRLRVLLTSLQIVDLRFLNHLQKLAFWINMYNACIMHGFLQYGVPSSSENLLTLMNKATLNIGGNTISAHTIEHFILRKPASSMLKEVYRKGDKEDKEVIVRKLYGLESSDPNVTFSLCYGTRSSPAVRIYTPDGVVAELERSKLDYLQASIVVTSTKRIALPALLLQKMHDFAPDMDSLVKWVCHQLPTSGSLRKSLVDCFRNLITSGGKVSAIVDKIPYDFEFQYLLCV